jgi:hypothetical protein
MIAEGIDDDDHDPLVLGVCEASCDSELDGGDAAWLDAASSELSGPNDDTTPPTAEELFNVIDANGDSLITFPELMAVNPGPSELFSCMFNLIVTDNADTNGRWSVVECRGA